MATAPEQQNPQAAHFAKLHEEYVRHYFDAEAMVYRRRFLYPALLAGVDLNGRCVADIGCAGGGNTIEIGKMFPAATFVGFDIVAELVDLYERETGYPGRRCDLTRPYTSDFEEVFDCIIIIGALHHMVQALDVAVANLARLLKPGGLLTAVEPSAQFFLEPLRKVWYRLDANFDASTEAAIDPRYLAELCASRFEVISLQHFGGPACFLVLQSMIMRIPPGVKRAIAPAAFAAEEAWCRLRWPAMHNYFAIQMRKSSC